MAAYISSRELKRTFSRMWGSISSVVSMAMVIPRCFSSLSNMVRPWATFSSRFSRLNHWRILARAWLLLASFIQSRLGPLAFLEVMISTISPDFSW